MTRYRSAVSSIAGQPRWWDVNAKAMLICRVSDKKQTDGVSLDAQDYRQTEYCAQANLTVADTVSFQESAKDTLSRARFHEAIARARKLKIRHLVFFSSDRLARNFTDFERLEKDIRAGVFVVHFAQDRRVLWKGSSDSELFLQDITTAQAKQENRIRSSKTVEGMEQRCRNGWYPSRPPAFYFQQPITDEHGRLKKRGSTVEGPTTDGRRLLRREMELRLEGLSFDLIRTTCVAEGLVPAAMLRSYFRSTVEKHLKNDFYAAVAKPHDGFRSQFTWRGMTYDAKHEPVFTAAEWVRLQASYGLKARYRKTKHQGLFSQGFRLTCAQVGCGCLMTYAPKTKKSGRTFRYYRCADGRFVHRRGGQRQVNVREEAILDQLGDALDSICIDDDLAEAIAHGLNASHRQARAAREGTIAELTAKVAEFDGQSDRLLDLLMAGTLESDEYKRQRERLKLLQASARSELEKQGPDDAYLVTADRVLELAKSAKKLWIGRAPAERVKLLERLVSNPRIDGRNVLFDLKKPFATLAKMREGGGWRPQRDLNPRKRREKPLSWATR